MRLSTTVISFARRHLAIALLLATACAPVEDSEQPAAADAAEPEVVQDEPPAFDDSAALRWVRANACDDQSPMSLTASDGSGLTLDKVKARAAIEGPIAMTELELTFDNPEDRTLEGRFAITLPPGAAISRFAMKIDGEWQEGEVVERQAARRAYEDFLHRKQDPALLENDAGNVFRARVFPIPARGKKDLIIAYSQTLPAEGEPYRIPLCGLPTLGELDVDVAIVRGAAYTPSSLGGTGTSVQHLSLRETNFAPTKDLEAWPGTSRAQGVRRGDLAIARIKPVLSANAEELTAMTILFDTSASRALDFTGQVDRLGRLVASLATEHPGLALKVIAFDQDVKSYFDGAAQDFGEAELAQLRARGAMGASNLGAALQRLSERSMASPRVLLIGDGVATAGQTDAAAMTATLKALQSDGVTRFDALVDGGIQDAALLAQLTREGLTTDGIVLDARMELSAIVDRLGKTTRSGIGVTVPGAEWVWPRTLDGVQPGDEVLIYAQLPNDQPMEVVLDGASVAQRMPTLAQVPGALLGRAHAEARIASLQSELSATAGDTDGGRARRSTLTAEIVTLSTRHRVLSDYTALLVLETDDDYQRFGIDRNALSDILTVGPSGVDVVDRAAKFRQPEDVANEPVADAWDGDKRPKLATKDTAEKEKASSSFQQPLGGERDPEVLEEQPGEQKRDEAPADDAAPPPPGAPPSPEPMADQDVPVARPDAPAITGRGGAGDGIGSLDASRSMDELSPGGRRGPSDARRRASRHHGEEGRMGGSVARAPEKPRPANPWDGRFAEVMNKLGAGDTQAAQDDAAAWRKESPGDVLALIALGESFEASHEPERAARAYGSLVDLFPSRADLRRMAGERLERLGDVGLALAIDTYEKAVEQRPDQPSGARLLAYALAKRGDHQQALKVLEAALDREYPSGRFAEVHRILREDLGLIAAALIAADRSAEKTVLASLSKRGAAPATTPSVRFVLTWETDANDVDLHIFDAKGGHAFYGARTLPSGGALYADVTTGYGPECFTIEGKPAAGPYTLQAHYYSRGPMGYGMGKLQVLTHDGLGNLAFEDHPFVIMRDDAYVDLATGEFSATTVGVKPRGRILK